MGETVKTIRVMVFDMGCPNCQRGQMYYTGAVVQTQDGDVMYHHVCSCCGYQNTYPKVYPTSVKIGEGEVLKDK